MLVTIDHRAENLAEESKECVLSLWKWFQANGFEYGYSQCVLQAFLAVHKACSNLFNECALCGLLAFFG